MSRTALGIFLTALLAFSASAQTSEVQLKANQIVLIADSVIVAKNDTTIYIPSGTKYQLVNEKYVVDKDFFSKVYSKAQKSRVTRELYNLLITERPPSEPLKQTSPVSSESFFKVFEGKTIKNIAFHSVPVVSGNVNDTSVAATSSFAKFSNKYHRNTKVQIIENHLLFYVGDKVNPFDIADSERIIRSLRYIEDVRIKLVINPEDIETVDALVIYKDRFPWSPTLSIDGTELLQIGFTNRNILGTGNEFAATYLFNRRQLPNHGYALSYTRRNIDNTFIDGTVYTSDSFLGKSVGLSFQRDFVSPQIKYYGEATLERVQPIDDLIFADSIYAEDFQSDRLTYDLWSGRAFQVGQRSNINFALRLQHDNYADRPTVRQDSNEVFHDHHLLLGALSYSKINFLKSKNILSFNITEDIPEGFLISILYGRDWNEFDPRTYRGARANYANYTDFGYFNLNFEGGFFRNQGISRNGVIELNLRYFSPLLDVGKAYSRIYTRFFFFDGERLSIPQSETLEGVNRIRNLDGEGIRGERVMTFSADYVVFQPWYWYGFRFAPYGHGAVGYVRESNTELPYSRTYSSLGAGIRIRNESLAFDTFDFRFSFFPDPPIDSNFFSFRFTLSAPSLFGAPNIRKPRVVGVDL